MNRDSPSLQDIDELLAYIPILHSEGFETIRNWQFETDAFPNPNYNPVVERFFRCASKQCWRDYDYRPVKAGGMLKDLNLINNATIDQIKTMLTYCVRGERFCDAHWSSMIEEGHILRLLKRLSELRVKDETKFIKPKKDTERNWYNGYSPKERSKKLKELKRRLAKGLTPKASGSCDLCNDPGVPVEYHSEDYSEPFLWEPPGLLVLCRHCHRHKLHKRFSDQAAWHTFVAHIRRGGYARDLRDKDIKKELSLYKLSLDSGKPLSLKELRPYRHVKGQEWFANLSLNPESLKDKKHRFNIEQT